MAGIKSLFKKIYTEELLIAEMMLKTIVKTNIAFTH